MQNIFLEIIACITNHYSFYVILTNLSRFQGFVFGYGSFQGLPHHVMSSWLHLLSFGYGSLQGLPHNVMSSWLHLLSFGYGSLQGLPHNVMSSWLHLPHHVMTSWLHLLSFGYGSLQGLPHNVMSSWLHLLSFGYGSLQGLPHHVMTSWLHEVMTSWLRGTGMIASSSTFRPHSGRVIRDLFRLLDAVTALYGSTSLQQSSKGSCSLLVSGYNLRADCQWHLPHNVPWFLRSTAEPMQHPHQCWR